MSVDRSIRYCAVIDKLGHILSQKYRRNLQPLLTEKESERNALLAAIRYHTRQSWEAKLGRLEYSVSRYHNAIRATIPFAENHLLLVSFDSDADNFDAVIIKKIAPLLEQ